MYLVGCNNSPTPVDVIGDNLASAMGDKQVAFLCTTPLSWGECASATQPPRNKERAFEIRRIAHVGLSMFPDDPPEAVAYVVRMTGCNIKAARRHVLSILNPDMDRLHRWGGARTPTWSKETNKEPTDG